VQLLPSHGQEVHLTLHTIWTRKDCLSHMCEQTTAPIKQHNTTPTPPLPLNPRERRHSWHQQSSRCIVAVSTCLSVVSVVCRSCHQVGRKCLAMIRNQGDQCRPLSGSIIAWSSCGGHSNSTGSFGSLAQGARQHHNGHRNGCSTPKFCVMQGLAALLLCHHAVVSETLLSQQQSTPSTSPLGAACPHCTHAPRPASLRGPRGLPLLSPPRTSRQLAPS
jgi:hypothetical protein